MNPRPHTRIRNLEIYYLKFSVKDIFVLGPLRINKCKDYLKRLETYRNIATIISILLITYNGLPLPKEPEDGDTIFFKCWQYHVASFTSLLVWVEMASFFF